MVIVSFSYLKSKNIDLLLSC